MEKTKNSDEKLESKQDLYTVQIGNMNVELIYSKNDKTFSQCILKVLKLKSKTN